MNDDKLRELGHELPWDRPDAARREAVRASLLIAAEDAPPRAARRGLALTGAFAAGAVAAAALALVVVHRDRSAGPTPRAQISASPAAELEHSVSPTAVGTDEVVRVHAGTVRIAAPATPITDHVRVQTRDAAVEGAGEYEVVVAHDRLASVTVYQGTARVAVIGAAQPVFLATGQTWHAAVITTDLVAPGSGAAAATVQPGPQVVSAPVSPSESSSATPAPPARRAAAGMRAAAPSTRSSRVDLEPIASEPSTQGAPTAVRASPIPRSSRVDPGSRGSDPPAPPVAATPPDAPRALVNTERPAATATARVVSPTERHFQAGWALLRADQPRRAAIELGLAADAGDREPLAIDARYFQAVALARAGAAREAETSLVAFLDHAPTSLRRGRAAVMLARLIAARGDAGSARAWFESALHDPDPEVVAAAGAGLGALPR